MQWVCSVIKVYLLCLSLVMSATATATPPATAAAPDPFLVAELFGEPFDGLAERGEGQLDGDDPRGGLRRAVVAAVGPGP